MRFRLYRGRVYEVSKKGTSPWYRVATKDENKKKKRRTKMKHPIRRTSVIALVVFALAIPAYGIRESVMDREGLQSVGDGLQSVGDGLQAGLNAIGIGIAFAGLFIAIGLTIGKRGSRTDNKTVEATAAGIVEG